MIMNSAPRSSGGGVKLVSFRAKAKKSGYTLFYTKLQNGNASIVSVEIPSDGSFVTVSDVPVCSVLWYTNESGTIGTSANFMDGIDTSYQDINGAFSVLFTIDPEATEHYMEV